ncbi:hypothetical protein F908_00699 [Acinetobacter sp. NIPH 284]|uniref:hypothetical protein n=1 Tax=Acinetobacter sp. NIPH 284 TaxID=1217704 RepID=UPI0002CE4967|nr:hypothetical protein [Acinetobacter sp. NIPH 284]ENW83801.1 hypothetical protein F908_00699 [Acinetobacter sp. NIPH 284]
MGWFTQFGNINSSAIASATQQPKPQEKPKSVQPKPEPKKSTPTPHWYKQKSEEVENHLKHIALMKLQLTKNLKDLQSQNGGHLWIDTDFIEPATETLQASLTQIQDLENRLQVLKLTYQDHL